MERHYRPAATGAAARRAAPPRWKILAAAERARRRLDLRLAALRSCGPADLLGDVRVHTRGAKSAEPPPARAAKLQLLADAVVVEEPKAPPAPPSQKHRRPHDAAPAPAEIAGFSVQVAAHARGSLYMDTLHSTLSRKALEQAGAKLRQRPLGTADLVEGLMGWLAHLGMPVGAVDAGDLADFEASELAAVSEAAEADVDGIVAMLIGTAGSDVAFGALVNALRVAASSARAASDDASGTDPSDVAGYGAKAYRELKRHVVEVNQAKRSRRAFSSQRDHPSAADSLMRLAKLVDAHGLDLQEIFLDTPVAAGVVRGDVRVPLAQLRKGLARLLGCAPLGGD